MSPRPGPRRPNVTLRMSEDTIGWIDTRAHDEGLTKSTGGTNRSQMLRLMVRYAMAKMPKGWRP